MINREITITGTNYDLTARELPNGTWHLFGEFDEFEIDNLWCDFELKTFEDADDALLAFITDEN